MKLRKIMAACMALIMCLAALPALPILADEEFPEMVVINPGFEEELTGWSPMKDGIATIDTSKAKSGNASLKITNSEKNNPWVTQRIEIPQAGALYELTAWLNVDVSTPDTVGTGFKVEAYKANGDAIREGNFDNPRFFQNTNNQWVKHTMIFQAPQETASVKVYMRCYSVGTTWYDDITLRLSGGPEPYSFFADHCFHYPDEETANAYIYLDNFYAADSEEAKAVYADFAVMDGEKVLHEKKNVSITGHEAKYTYPVSIMTEKEKQYKLVTKLYKKSGELYNEWAQNLYVYDRPEWMPEDGKFLINGEPFNPIFGYHVDYDDIEEVKAGGLNTVQLGNGIYVEENRRLLLPELDKHDVKGFASLYPGHVPAGHPDNIEKTKATMAALKDDDSVIAWIVQDEPLGAGINMEQMKLWLEDSYRLIRSIDKKRPIYLLDYGTHHKETIKYCDVFVADVYQRGASATAVSQIIEPLTESHPSVSTYELACAFNDNGPELPPVRTIRASIYRGLEAGGSYGAGYFSITDSYLATKGEEKAPLYEAKEWESITTINTVELPVMFEYVNGYGITSFNKYREGELYSEHLWETWFNEKGEMYLLAHNRNDQTAEFNIPLVSKNGKIRVGEYNAEPIGLTETGAISGNGSMTLTLEQEQIALYKIVPTEKVDLSLIDAPTFDDLDGDYAWAKEAIVKTQALGIINGKGEGVFAPGEAISRGDFAGFLIRTLGFTSESTENFSDVPAEREYAKEIATGRALGILNGVGENMFSPEAAITRQDMMTIAARGMKLASKLAAADASALDAFHDKANVADYALESVASMIQSGIIKGDDAGYLNPTGNTRRAEAAVIMQRILHAEIVTAGNMSSEQMPKVENEVISFTKTLSEEELRKYNRSISLLKGLGSTEISPEKSLTNGEAEAILSSLLGYTFDGFGENHKALTTGAAAEAFVKLLGYEAYTQRDGGFMGVASRLDLLKGVDTSEEYLRGGAFAVMCENALGVYLADPAGYGGGAESTYIESQDTLLTRYRHLDLYKGILEQNDKTGLGAGKVAVGTNLLETGETDAAAFIGQKVEAYTEGEDRTIVYIRPAKNVKITKVEAKDIVPGQTTLASFTYEDAFGAEKKISIAGAQVLYNGKYKTDANVDTITPTQGVVTLIENASGIVDYILVDAYTNYIVDSIFAEDKLIFFKNRDTLTWDETDKAFSLSMEGASYEALKEWDVVSLYESEDGKVLRAVVSNKTVKGTATELSTDDIMIDGTAYTPAANMYGTIALGKEYTYLLDACGLVAGINDNVLSLNYVYFTSIFQKQGLDGTVQIRLFNTKGEMKVMDVKDTVNYNGAVIPAGDLMEKPELVKDGTPVGQLIVIETAGEETQIITAIDTAENGMIMSNEERWATFTLDEQIGHNGTDEQYSAKRRYEGHDALYIGGKYLVEPSTLYFVVPSSYSEDVSDYHVYSSASIKHNDYFEDTKLYDVNEDQETAVIVKTVVDSNTVGIEGNPAVVKRIGRAINEDGEEVVSITLQRQDEFTLYFPKEDYQIYMKNAITSIAKGEPMQSNGILHEYITPSALEVGDVVLYQTLNSDPNVISTMRVLCRAKYAVKKEYSQNSINEYYNYSELTYAYGRVDRVVKRGIMLTPAGFERLFILDVKSDKNEKPIILVENGKVKTVTQEHVQVGDMVYVQKCNPWQQITVIYR